MKLIMYGVLVLFMLGMVSAGCSTSTDILSYNSCKSGVTDTVKEVVKPKFHYGSKLFTKYGWDGEKCIKRDLLRRPTIAINHETHRAYMNSDGSYVMIQTYIDGDKATAWDAENRKVIKEVSCDESKIDIAPLELTGRTHG